MTVQTPAPRGFARLLSHAVFWPCYSAFVVVLILVFRPWEKWLQTQLERTTAVQVHTRLPADPTHAGIGQVLIALARAGELGDGWLPCDVRRLRRQDYPSLARQLVSRNGSDSEEFTLPDCRPLTIAILGAIHPTLQVDASTTDDEDDLLAQHRLRFWIRAR